jgi:hypothetical protein
VHAAPAVRNDARSGLFVHIAHTRFSVAEHAVDSNAPSAHLVHWVQAAIVVCRTAVEYVPEEHCVGAIDPWGQNPPAGHSIGWEAGVGQKKPGGHTSGAKEPEGQ